MIDNTRPWMTIQEINEWAENRIKSDDQTPQRPWVGLTDEDKSLFSSWLDHKTDDEVFAAIEDKLRSKNT